MKHLFFTSLFLVAASFSSKVFAQDATLDSFLSNAIDTTSSEDEPGTGPEKKEDLKVIRYHHQLRIPSTFEGSVVELCQSERPLIGSEDIFKQFGNIYYTRLRDGRYSYCILATSFRERKEFKKYYTNMVLPRMPKAVAIDYVKGERFVLNW